ncbi:MAG: hypothetical protein ACXVJ7_12660 [Acidimicrobiia bacterium]
MRVTLVTLSAIALVSVLSVAVAKVVWAQDDSTASARSMPATQPMHTHGSDAMADMPGMSSTTDTSAGASTVAADDKGLSLLSNGHHHAIGEEHALTADERTMLAHQVEMSMATAKLYPTVSAALAAGYVQTGPYMPGIGAHYIHIGPENFNFDGAMDDVDITHPLAMIYSGTDPTSPIAGFMYYSMSKTEPMGFAGGNDVWHYHEDLCLKYGGANGIEVPYGLDNSATPKQCAAVGGSLLKQSNWMVHVWSVPGWESRQGLFGEVNPALMCPDGSYYEYPPAQWSAHPMNACKSAT